MFLNAPWGVPSCGGDTYVICSHISESTAVLFAERVVPLSLLHRGGAICL